MELSENTSTRTAHNQVAPAPDSVTTTVRTPKNDKRQSKKWNPYKLSWTEIPALFWLSSVLPYWIRVRQCVLRNGLFSWRPPFPLYKAWDRAFTLGELLLAFLLIGGTVGYTTHCFVEECNPEYAGQVANYVTVLVFMFASRNSIFTLLMGIPFERALFWHKLIAICAVVLSWVHGVRVVQYGKSYEDEMGSGYAYAVTMSGLLLLSLVWIRRHVFNLFHVLHIVLIVVIIITAIIHEAGQVMIGAGLWCLDLIVRYLILAFVRNPHRATATRLPANVIRLSFPKRKFEYSPGQYVFLMIPDINVFEWHPFSISSAPYQEQVTIHIRVLGNWTRSLYELVSEVKQDSMGDDLKREMTVYMEGPYGSPEVDVESAKYRLFLCVSGGIGITPLQSITNQLLHEHSLGRPIKKIWFVWSCADKYMISANFEHDNRWGIPSASPYVSPTAEDTNPEHRLPLSFQPDNLVRFGHRVTQYLSRSGEEEGSELGGVGGGREEEVLESQFYLTRVRNEADFGNANIWPHLQPYLKFGRPNLEEIFRSVSEWAVGEGEGEGEGRVAVLCCGPTGMIDSVRGHCGKHSSGKVAFDFHGEVFQF